MSRITVQFVGPVRRPGPERTVELQTELATVGELLADLGYSTEEQGSLQALADGRRARASTPLRGVRTIEILIAIGGG
jgi:sulfur carrier protein ThiS